MSQPAKTTTTAKPAATPAPKVKRAGRAPAVDFDFSNVTVADAPAPVRKNGGAFTPPPAILKALQDSWADRKVANQRTVDGVKRYTYIGSGKSMTVPTEAATTVLGVIRRTGVQLGLGVAVSREVKGKLTTLTFAAKTPKQSKNGSE